MQSGTETYLTYCIPTRYMTSGQTIRFEDLTQDNWDEFDDTVMGSEEDSFPENIMWEEEDFMEYISRPDCIAKALVSGEYYLGNVIGYPLTEEDIADQRLEGMVTTDKTIHLINIVVEHSTRMRGYGRMLLEEFIRCAKQQGYRRLVGNFRPNGSLHLIKSMGAKELRMHKDWEGTDEDYISCELEL